jgi:hypothetical protein
VFAFAHGYGAHIGRPIFWVALPLFAFLVIVGISQTAARMPPETWAS